jgi:hypothetical protein
MSARPQSGHPVPGEFPSPAATPAVADGPAAATEAARREILRRAELLEIPWERLLLEEIQTEQTLRRYVPDVSEMPLSTRLTLLTFSFLRSWRVRDQILGLSSAARASPDPAALRQLRMVFRHLIGQPAGNRAALAGHLWFAYQRVLLLQRVCRAARRSRGDAAERMAFVCAKTCCSFDDAAWALAREGSPRPGHRMDDAVRKVREEGFQIPRASNEARSFAELRRMIRATPPPGVSRRSWRAARSVALPARVPLPADAV